MKTSAFLLLSCLFLAVAPASRSATIWDNGGPDQLGFVASDFDTPQQLGGDFTLAASATANQIQWWGVYSFTNTPTALDDFIIRFFTITGGVPATAPLFSYAIGEVAGVDTGLNVAQFDIYSFSAIIPDTLLGPGDYLLSIVNNTAADTDDNWSWATSSAFAGTSWFRANEGEAWATLDFEFAFNISGPNGNGTAVPDTGTSALLFAFGLAAIFFVQRFLGWRSVAV